MKIQRFTIDTKFFGPLPVLRPVPTEQRQDGVLMVDPWGILAPVRDHASQVAKFIPVVSGEDWSNALHGHSRPLMLKVGPTPKAILKMLPRIGCTVKDDCIMYDVKRCVPTKRIPECWTPVVEEAAREAVALVVHAWAEDRYVVVVEGDEFSLGSGK